MSKISIIIPIYKVEQYIDKCIQSILAQTFTDFELLLIDDGSPDKSGEMCDAWAQKDSRVVVIHKENGGVSSARNVGLENAKGEYIMFCDSDDYVEPTWCEELLGMIEQHPNSWCFCGCNCVDAYDNVFGPNCVYNTSVVYQTLPISEYWNIYTTNYSALLWIRIFQTSIIKENNIRFDENMSVSEDVLFNLEYGKYCDEIAIVNLPLYNHRSYLNDECEHLDGKLPKEQFYMNCRIYSARRKLVPKERAIQFETDAFYRFINDMKSIAANTDLNSKNKLKKLKQILTSAEFKSAMNNADTSMESQKLLILLKLKMSRVLLFLFKRG